MTAHSATEDFPKPDDYYALGLDVKCNYHVLFAARTRRDAEDAVQYLKALAAMRRPSTPEEGTE